MSKLRAKATKDLEAVEVDALEVEGTLAVDEISVIDNAVKTAKAEEAKVETVKEIATEPKVRINPNRDIRTFIGDQWYNLKAGKQVSVPRNVKEKLQKAGLLSPL